METRALTLKLAVVNALVQNQHAPRRKFSIESAASVNVQTGPSVAYMHHKSLTKNCVYAGAQQFFDALHTRSSTGVDASVNVQPHDQSVSLHKFSIAQYVTVNVPDHDQNALLHKCSMTGPASASVLK